MSEHISESNNLLDIIDEYEDDADTCEENEIARVFPLRYQVCKKTVLSESFQDSNTCVLLVANKIGKTLAAANKKGDIILVDAATGTKSLTLEAHSKDITDLKFCDVYSSVLYSSSLDGTLKLLDLRSNKFEHTYKHADEDGDVKEFSCLDINCSGEFLCGGTNLVDDDSYLLFWDVRNSNKHLGGYWEGHSDDITKVRFHPNKRQQLASAAMDNLVNVYDISKKSESDAFSYCINFETTPDTIYWDPDVNSSSKMFAVNYPQLVQYWNIEDTTPLANIDAKTLCKAMKRKFSSQCHLISLNFDEHLNPLMMASSNLGSDNQENACIRTLSYNREKKKLRPHSVLELKGNKVVKVFDSIYLPSSEVFVTLESGSLRYWRQQGQKRSTEDINAHSSTKMRK